MLVFFYIFNTEIIEKSFLGFFQDNRLMLSGLENKKHQDISHLEEKKAINFFKTYKNY